MSGHDPIDALATSRPPTKAVVGSRLAGAGVVAARAAWQGDTLARRIGSGQTPVSARIWNASPMPRCGSLIWISWRRWPQDNLPRLHAAPQSCCHGIEGGYTEKAAVEACARDLDWLPDAPSESINILESTKDLVWSKAGAIPAAAMMQTGAVAARGAAAKMRLISAIALGGSAIVSRRRQHQRVRQIRPHPEG